MVDPLQTTVPPQQPLLLPLSFPWEATKEWTFIVAVCAVANAVILAVDAVFSAQLLFSAGFVFLGLSTLLGVYYFFQARALEGHVVVLSQDLQNKDASITKLTGENLRLLSSSQSVRDQHKALSEKLAAWNSQGPKAELANPVAQLELLVTQYLALTREEEKKRQLDKIEADRKALAEEREHLNSRAETLNAQEENISSREANFNKQKEQTLAALSTLASTAMGLIGLGEAIRSASKEILSTARETGQNLDPTFSPKSTLVPSSSGPALSRLLTMTTPQKPIKQESIDD